MSCSTCRNAWPKSCRMRLETRLCYLPPVRNSPRSSPIITTATADRVVAGNRTLEVARVRITEAGRRALQGIIVVSTEDDSYTEQEKAQRLSKPKARSHHRASIRDRANEQDRRYRMGAGTIEIQKSTQPIFKADG